MRLSVTMLENAWLANGIYEINTVNIRDFKRYYLTRNF